MNENARHSGRLSFLLKVALPICTGALLAILMGTLSLVWSTQRIDLISIERQKALATVVLHQSRGAIAHDQESSTVWDDAVNKVLGAPDADWFDGNLGSWMHTYFGHDSLFVIDPANKPIYAFANGSVQPAEYFNKLAPIAVPMAEQLRQKIRNGESKELDARHLSLGVADFAILDNRPAIISLKPIVSDSGEIEQPAGGEFIHLAVRYLDGSFLAELSKQYQFEELSFSSGASPRSDLTSLLLTSNGGLQLGYVVWKPVRPGSDFLQSMAPLLIGVVTMVILLVATIISVLYRRSVANALNQARIRFLAHHDTLTGLPNRHSFDCDLDRQLATSALATNHLAVLYLDLDRFKKVNDTLGHAAGDTVICEASSRVSALLENRAKLYRIGGDEFIVVVTDRSRDAVFTLCDAIVSAVNEPITIDINTIYIGVSIGVAFGPEHGEDRATLTRKADIALYHAKASGRSRYCVFGNRMDALVAEKARLEQDLRSALAAGDQLKVYYQPKINALTGELVGAEALVRWYHPERGILSPELFIAIAEDAGLIGDLGQFVLESACRATSRWPIESVAVNVSAPQLKDASFALMVAAILQKTGLEPERLELEITESAWIEEDGAGEQNLESLRRMGVKIALDDFGTGFSSLGRLQALKVDRIKIDKSFVAGLGNSAGDEAIIRAIINMALAHGLSTTAEGVETEAQRDFLREIGCDEFQGFLYSQAISEIALGEVLEQSNPSRRRA